MSFEESDALTSVTNDDGSFLREEPIDTSLEDGEEDPEIEAIKTRVREMEEEAEKLKEMQKAAEELSPTHSHTSHSAIMTSPITMTGDNKAETDARSVYVGNVDYSATATDLEQHFHGCGAVNRVTILCDKFSGQPKGFAYVEFTEKESIENACQLTDSLFKGRQIKVTPKRTNIPGVSTTNRFPRTRFRGRGRGYYSGYSGGYGGYYSPRPRARGGYRPRRSNWFSPY